MLTSNLLPVQMQKNSVLCLQIMLSLLFGFSLQAIAGDISVSTDRNPISIDESFRITFTATDSPDDNPDFSPLEQDFEILSQSNTTSSSWINGKSSKTVQWILTVMAKQAGNLTIPAIKFGNDISQSGSVTVTQSNTSNNSVKTDDDLYLEVAAIPESPYVQSQVIFRLRLYTRIDIAQAKLNEPELADAVIEKLGDDNSYNTLVNGVNYSVTERKYAIFPQKSGKMTIKPLVLNAEVVTAGRPSFGGFFNQQFTRTKRVESKAITLDVKPAPAEFKGPHWLSAEELHFKQEWSGDIQQMKVGEPLTRTLSLLAKGTTVGQLPELNAAKIDDQIKTYPDQPTLQEQKKPEGIIAFREEKIALIPSKSGEYTLSAIEIPWFNTQSKKVEIAKIPATHIKVAAVPGAQPVQPVTKTPINKTDNAQKIEPIQALQTEQQHQDNIWIWIAGFLAFGWLTSLIYFLTKGNTGTTSKPKKRKNLQAQQDAELKTIIKNLNIACNNNDANTAKDNLLLWGKQKFNAANLGSIASYCDARLKEEILILNQVLYGKDSNQWNGKHLIQAFNENKVGNDVHSKLASELEPLYRI